MRGPHASFGGFSNVRVPGQPWTVAREDNRARMVSGARIRRGRIERRVLIVDLGPGRLIVEAKAERQRQLVRHLELVVDPRPRVRLAKRRLDRNRLVRALNLAEQERRERIAGRPQVVAAGVEPGRAETIEMELPGHRSHGPPAEREVVVAELESALERVPALRPTSGRPRTASGCSPGTRSRASHTAPAGCKECCRRSSEVEVRRWCRECLRSARACRPRVAAATARRPPGCSRP